MRGWLFLLFSFFVAAANSSVLPDEFRDSSSFSAFCDRIMNREVPYDSYKGTLQKACTYATECKEVASSVLSKLWQLKDLAVDVPSCAAVCYDCICKVANANKRDRENEDVDSVIARLLWDSQKDHLADGEISIVESAMNIARKWDGRLFDNIVIGIRTGPESPLSVLAQTW